MSKKKKKQDDEFLYEQRKKLIGKTMLYQRRVFIESLRKGDSFSIAMKNSGITDRFTALLIYNKNSKVVTHRVLVAPEKVR